MPSNNAEAPAAPEKRVAENSRTGKYDRLGLGVANLLLALNGAGCAVQLDQEGGTINAQQVQADYRARQSADQARRTNSPTPSPRIEVSRRAAATRFEGLTATLRGEVTHPVFHPQLIEEFTGGPELYNVAHTERVISSDQARSEQAHLFRAIEQMQDPSVATVFSSRCVEGDLRSTTTTSTSSASEGSMHVAMCRIRGADIYQTTESQAHSPEVSTISFPYRVTGVGHTREEAAVQAFGNLSQQVTAVLGHNTETHDSFGDAVNGNVTVDYHSRSAVFQMAQLRVAYTTTEAHQVQAEISTRVRVNVPRASLQRGSAALAIDLAYAGQLDAEEVAALRAGVAGAQDTEARPAATSRHHGRHGSSHRERPSSPLVPNPFDSSSSGSSHHGHRRHSGS